MKPVALPPTPQLSPHPLSVPPPERARRRRAAGIAACAPARACLSQPIAAARRRLRTSACLLVAAGSLALLPSTASAGDGGFTGDLNLAFQRPESLAVGDFNNDGRPDLAVVSGTIEKVGIFLQTPDGELLSHLPVAAGKSPELIAVADFNRDGNEDIAVTHRLDHQVSVRLGLGDGTFTNAPDVDLAAGHTSRSLVVGDFDNDTRDDLAVGTTTANGGDAVRVRMGVGNGTFVAGTSVSATAAALVVGDFNEDAVEDLVHGRPNAFVAGVLLGKGGGTFEPGPNFGLFGPVGSANALAVADFDGDGHADVLAATSDDRVSVRRGAGDGTFERGEDFLPGAGARPLAAAVGDFDSDGREDFLVSDSAGSGTVHVRLGDGAGGFRAAPDVAVGTFPIDVAVADFNGDGNADLVTANYGADTISVRHGTGRAPLAGNLLVNGGFEGPVPSGDVRPTPLIAGWQLSGGISYLRYGAPSHAYAPSWVASPRFGTGGGRMLWGGSSAATNGVTSASQTVDVSASASAIDGGRATANLSAYLGGSLSYADAMSARAEFLDAAGTSLAALELGPVTPTQRRNISTLLRRAGARAVPPGTRRIRVTLTSDDADKTYSAAMADNVKLTLDTRPADDPGPGGGPGGSGGPDADREAPMIGRVTLTPARFAVARRATASTAAARGTTIRYTLSEAAAVTLRVKRAVAGRRVKGACRPVTARTRTGRPCRRYVAAATLRRTGRPGANRVAFSGRIGRRALRRGAYRLVVSAADAAGNRSTARPRSFRIVR